MQMIAEVYGVMRDGLGMNPAGRVRSVQGAGTRVRSTPTSSRSPATCWRPSSRKTGKPLVELILDKAGQKGTGVWSAIAGQQLGVPATAIEGAVAARSISSRKDERVAAEAVYGKPHAPARPTSPLADLEKALLAGKIVSYAQGFAVMAKASRGERLEPAARHHRQDLARRLHHPLALPRPDVGRLRQGRRAPIC